MRNVEQIRRDLGDTFPELNDVCSDAYIRRIVSVPGRAFEYARDEKIANALIWRRDFGVDDLCNELIHIQEEWIATDAITTCARPGVLELCRSGSLAWQNTTKPILHSLVGYADWTDTLAIMQHHVRVIEHGITNVLPLTNAECFSVVVDVSSLDIFCMPSVDVVKGLVTLFQKAYPERIDRIYVAPVNMILRGHHNPIL